MGNVDYFESESDGGSYSDDEDSFEENSDLSVAEEEVGGEEMGKEQVVKKVGAKELPSANLEQMKDLAKYGNLNGKSDAELTKIKGEMDEHFEANRIKKGDEGFVWDKQVQFEEGDEASSWD